MTAHRIVHIVALASLERAEQARACYAIGVHAEIYSNYEELVAARPRRGLVLAEDIAERGGIAQLLADIAARGFWLPVVATARAVAPHRVVAAVKAGALDYLALPLDPAALAATLRRAEEEALVLGEAQQKAVAAQARLELLTPREAEVLDLLVAGASNKSIARELQISPRTVEIHRANMMTKLDARHPADAVRMRLEASAAPRPGAYADLSVLSGRRDAL
jgi:two-component system, LuxR family, response regulator FixJ